MGKVIGYCRISDRSQKTDSQVDQLQAYGVDEIITETVSGVSADKRLYELIEQMEEGSTLCVLRPDRLARNTKMLLEVVEKLEEKSIDLVIVSLGIDTRTPVGKLVLTIMAGVSQWERDELKIKQKNGVKSAKKRGVKFGPKPQFEEEGLQWAMQLYQENHPVSYISKVTKVPRATLYRRLKERGITRQNKQQI
ncbi:recombinase family protein [Rossellomorea marisflavi]|uniref:recombinase family protein n=1 Tax=Rossellomorea marisflavi TaxID=189381 RepID=UPI001EE1FB98|nr:recombinase family protein [Rossellomorea marisflavi]UKS67699.1 recombinase family protein [Rossellomorea marisflavi]